MKLIIKENLPHALEKRLEEFLTKVENAIIFRLQLIGERFVTNARNKSVANYKEYQKALSEIAFSRHGQRVQIGLETPGFMDHTGNLRSSIGYMIFKDGEPIKQAFAGEMEEGKQAGISLANGISKTYPKGFVLIVVAGMEYAAAVESKGYDVITSSSFTAEDELKEAMEGLNKKIPLMQ